MNNIKDYEEKKRILTYFSRESKGGVTKAGVTRLWTGWWKEDKKAIKDNDVLDDICKTVLELVIPTREMGRQKTLDYQKEELFKYKNRCYHELKDLAQGVGWDIQNQTSKKHPVYLGRYRIKGTRYIGTFDEIKDIIRNKKNGGNKNNE